MSASAYATVSDLAQYLPGPDQANNATIWTALLNSASRLIDKRTGQYFFADGVSTRYFNGTGDNYLDTGKHSFYVKSGAIASAAKGATSLIFTQTAGPAPIAGDIFTLDNAANLETATVSAVAGTSSPYTLTVGATNFAHVAATVACTMQLKLGYFENQPLANWLGPLAGDGVTPPSNFWLVPRNPGSAESSVDPTAQSPYYGIELATIPIAQSSYLPAFLPMYNVASVTVNWGWPQVPDSIKNLTLKLAARGVRAAQTGWQVQIGTPDLGVIDMSRFLDREDAFILNGSSFKRWSF